MGIMVWSPLGSGPAQGKIQTSPGGEDGSGSGTIGNHERHANPGFKKFNERN